MSDTQEIKGVTFPNFIGPFRIYPYDALREDGEGHESSRVLVRVRRKKRLVELTAVKLYGTVYGKYSVELPALGCGRASSIASAARFTFELNQALMNCREALSQDR